AEVTWQFPRSQCRCEIPLVPSAGRAGRPPGRGSALVPDRWPRTRWPYIRQKGLISRTAQTCLRLASNTRNELFLVLITAGGCHLHRTVPSGGVGKVPSAAPVGSRAGRQQGPEPDVSRRQPTE